MVLLKSTYNFHCQPALPLSNDAKTPNGPNIRFSKEINCSDKWCNHNEVNREEQGRCSPLYYLPKIFLAGCVWNVILFLAPTGAQGVTISVPLSVPSVKSCLDQSIFIILVLIMKETSSSRLAVLKWSTISIIAAIFKSITVRVIQSEPKTLRLVSAVF